LSTILALVGVFFGILVERGFFFREEGLDPQLVQVRATAAIAAIVSDEVHALGSKNQFPEVRRERLLGMDRLKKI